MAAGPRVTDTQLAGLLGGAMFLAVAWPLFFLKLPPYQDLPGHLAAVTVLANPSLYPELVPTGFLKPNSFFFVWTLYVGRAVGFAFAAKLYALAVLAANAFVLPRFVLHATDRLGHSGGEKRLGDTTQFLIRVMSSGALSEVRPGAFCFSGNHSGRAAKVAEARESILPA